MLSSVLLILTTCVSGLPAGLVTLSEPVINAFLSGHNELRSSLNLSDLVWNSTLVNLAESHVVDCNYNNFEDKGTSYTSTTPKADSLEVAKGAVKLWSRQANKVDPNWACIDEGACRCYSQVVWRNTTSVGCVIFQCSKFSMDLVKCEYDPPGNVNGEIPY